MKTRLLILAIAALAFSCDDDDDEEVVRDTTAPVVTITEPEDHEEFDRGAEMHVEGTITDDRALAEFKIDIHNANDGHGHGGKRSGEWDYEETFTISGLKWEFHEDVMIPDSADTGIYHVIITALDAAGNQSELAERDIHIHE